MKQVRDGGFLTITRFAGNPDELRAAYDRTAEVMAQVGGDHDLILHSAALTDEGLVMVNLWPSQEESEAASRDPRRLEALRSSGLAPEQMTRDHYELISCYGAAG